MHEILCMSTYMLCLGVTLGQIPIPAVGNTSLWTFAANLGLSVALVIFFVIKNDKRELRTSKRIEHLEIFQETTLLKTIESSSLAILEATHSQNEFSSSLSHAVESLQGVAAEVARLQRTLESRPCVAQGRAHDRTDPRQEMEAAVR